LNEKHLRRLTPFNTSWDKGSGATPLAIQDLLEWDAISISTARTKCLIESKRLALRTK